MGEGLLTLVGVVIGAGLTMLTTVGVEMGRVRRADGSRWMDQRLDAFAEYVISAKQVVTLARRIQRAVDWNEVSDQQLQDLADAELERSLAAEKVVLLTNSRVVLENLARLNRAAWMLEKPSRLGQQLDREEYERCVSDWHAALDSFHLEARTELGIEPSPVSYSLLLEEGATEGGSGVSGLAR